ncbi:hypothetical protein RQM47_16405 [Rubrivirga sp. S365]|uniref:hypothetical protein n=1 Tax=Rubrivirga sp. S365 TaxID=3076080 RepID=UPI0028C98B5B|nr:hypothetical protein [Rubrivirga sp. S365]MDT7858232.1 hypothetical protein [Rubrivirga sp. S365]
MPHEAPDPTGHPTGHPPRETAVFAADHYGLMQPRRAVTADVVVAYGLAVATHPDWRPGFTEVWDLRFAPVVDLGPADAPVLLDLERRTARALTGSATVIVATRPSVLFSVKFYARLANPLGRTVVAVGTEAGATALLGVAALPDLRSARRPAQRAVR